MGWGPELGRLSPSARLPGTQGHVLMLRLGEPWLGAGRAGGPACRHRPAPSGTLRLRRERPSRLVPLNTASLILAFGKLAANADMADFLGLVDKVWLKGDENEDVEVGSVQAADRYAGR